MASMDVRQAVGNVTPVNCEGLEHQCDVDSGDSEVADWWSI